MYDERQLMEACCVGGEGRFPFNVSETPLREHSILKFSFDKKNKIFHKKWWRIKLTLISPFFAAPLFDLAQDEVVKEKAVEAAEQFFANRFVHKTWTNLILASWTKS